MKMSLQVVLSARNPEALEETVADLRDGPGTAMALPLDVTDEDAVNEAARTVLDRFGRVDVLVNNAGLTQRARVADTDTAVFRRVMDVNYFGALMLTKAVLPSMTGRGAGRIVAISSVAGKYGSPTRSGYCAAKHAVQGFFDALREEVWADGIGVTVIVPGAVRTNVSINALTGDGTPYAKMDPFLEQGFAPEDVASRILEAVDRGEREVMIARGVARRNVVLKRLSPWLLERAMRKGKRARR